MVILCLKEIILNLVFAERNSHKIKKKYLN